MKNHLAKRKVIEISYKHKLSHLGSVLGALDVIYDIYIRKNEDDKVILSAGHCGLALYVALEDFENYDAEKILKSGGIHPDALTMPVDCSSGSLGHGLGIAVGMAIAEPEKTIHVISSDGELAEGSMWEALEVIRNQGITNIQLHVLCNGTSGYKFVSTEHLKNRLKIYNEVADLNKDITGFITKKHEFITIHELDVSKDFPFLTGIDAHYHTMSEKDYDLAMEITNLYENQ